MTTGRINQIAFVSFFRKKSGWGGRRQRPRKSGSLAPCDIFFLLQPQLMPGNRTCNRTVFRLQTHCPSRERGLCETSRVSVLGTLSNADNPRPKAARHRHGLSRERSSDLVGPLPGSLPTGLDHTRPWEPFLAFRLFCASTLMLHIYSPGEMLRKFPTALFLC